MKIDDELNLVIPLDGGVSIYSAPLSDAIFDTNYRLLSKAQDVIFGNGLDRALLTGPRIAALVIRDAGKEVAAETGLQGDAGATALLAEIKRGSLVLHPTDGGYEYAPVQAAIDKGTLDPADWKEVEGALCFFTCLWLVESRKTRKPVLELVAQQMNCITTSQSVEDYVKSLTTPSKDVSSSGKAESSVPV